jgi:hypothetical protein
MAQLFSIIAAALTLVTALGCDVEVDASGSGLAELDAGPTHEKLVGEVEDSDVRVGVLADDARLRVFLCGGPSSYASATHWLRAELDGDGDFSFRSDELELTGTLVDGVLEAELVADGERSMVRAERVRGGTLAGLYEARADCGTVGLIVTHDGPDSEPTAQGACVGEGHLPDQVNPIKPISRDSDGAIAVEVVRGDEATRADLLPATL